jgi:hypothetical protein
MKLLKLNTLLAPITVGICLTILSGCATTPLSQSSAKDIAIKAMGSQMLKTSYEAESISSFSLVRLEAEEVSSADLKQGIDNRIEVEDYSDPDQAMLSSSGGEQTALVATLSADTAFDTLRAPQDLPKISAERALEIKEQIYERVYAAIEGENSSLEIVDLAALTAQDVVIEQMQPRATGYFDMTPEEQDQLHATLGSELDDTLELSYQVDENIYMHLDKVLKPTQNPQLQPKGPSKLLGKLLGDSVFMDELNQHSLSPFYVKQHLAYLPRQSKISGVQAFGFDNDYSKAEMKVPFEANWQELSLTVDPGALLPIAPFFVSEDNNFLAGYSPGDSVRLQIPKSWVDEDTRDLVVGALLNSVDSTLASFSPDLFTSVSVSAAAKNMGASRAILMELESKDQVEFLVTLVRDVANNIKLGMDDSGLTDEQKLKYGSLADRVLKMSDEIYAKYQNDADVKQAVEKQLGKLTMTLYVDSRGRLTGAEVEQFSEIKTQDGMVLGINTQSVVDIKNFGSAKAPFAPEANQIIDGNAILAKFLEERRAKKALLGTAGENSSDSRAPLSGDSLAQAQALSALMNASENPSAPSGALSDEELASAPDADQLSLWMETNKILVESDPESKAEFCEIYTQYDASSADQKSAALDIFSQNTLSSDAAGAAAAGSVFYRYLAKSYSDQNLDCGVPAP